MAFEVMLYTAPMFSELCDSMKDPWCRHESILCLFSHPFSPPSRPQKRPSGLCWGLRSHVHTRGHVRSKRGRSGECRWNETQEELIQESWRRTHPGEQVERAREINKKQQENMRYKTTFHLASPDGSTFCFFLQRT